MTTCRICKEDKSDSEFFLSSNKVNLDRICKACKHTRQQERRHSFKVWLVEYMGGGCEKCGYNRCVFALDVHHRDPSKKEFEFKGCDLKNKTRVIKELENCHLLCATCHREVHHMNDRLFIE